MKTILLFLTLNCLQPCLAQTPKNITTNISTEGTSEKSDLSLFHLNHVLYIKAFVLSDIYSTVSTEEMAYITSTLSVNLKAGKRTQFIIKTPQKIAYRLAVFTLKKDDKELLVILTNFNAQTGKFEQEIRESHYASTAEISANIVHGDLFELPYSNKEKYENENDYLSLINTSIFHTIVDTIQMNNWFSLVEKTQSDKLNNIHWLKSYYHLTQSDFTASKQALEALKTTVSMSPEGEKKNWEMFIKVLSFEINVLEAVKNSN